MRRKLIEQLLAAGDQGAAAEKALSHLAGEEAHAAALRVLVAGLKRATKSGRATPEELHGDLCTSPATAVASHLRGTAVARLSLAELTNAQIVLNTALTSRAGRPRTSEKSREEQLSEAQLRRRSKLKKEGRIELRAWISAESSSYLESVKEAHGCSDTGGALELVLQAQKEGVALKPPE